MRTTIRLDDQVLADAKENATRTGTTLSALIEDSLRRTLFGRGRLRRRDVPELPTFRGDGLQPGSELDNSASLLALADTE